MARAVLRLSWEEEGLDGVGAAAPAQYGLKSICHYVVFFCIVYLCDIHIGLSEQLYDGRRMIGELSQLGTWNGEG